MELIIPLVGIPVLLLVFFGTFRPNNTWRQLSLYIATVLEVLVILTIFLDWGYKWVDLRGYSIALQRNVWILLPQVLSGLVLVVLIGSRLKHSWLAFFIAILEIPLLFIMIYNVELDMDLSLLTPASVFCMVGSALAAILLIPTVVHTVPTKDSRWWKVVFGSREELFNDIKELSYKLGLKYNPPKTLLEAGSTQGELPTGYRIQVTTRPRMWPPDYAYQVEITGKKVPVSLIKNLPAGIKILEQGKGILKFEHIIRKKDDYRAGKLIEIASVLLRKPENQDQDTSGQ